MRRSFQPPAANADAPLRAALYMRVSTGRQADSDLSIPDQQRQLTTYCATNGWQVAGEFIDAGLSGTDENRPQFQRMLDLATGSGTPFDVILVYSFSRFARDLVVSELSIRRLYAHGVRLVSISQELGDDLSSQFMRKVYGLLAEQHSLENSCHVTRTMKENANQGFWNGAAAPFGTTPMSPNNAARSLKKSFRST